MTILRPHLASFGLGNSFTLLFRLRKIVLVDLGPNLINLAREEGQACVPADACEHAQVELIADVFCFR